MQCGLGLKQLSNQVSVHLQHMNFVLEYLHHIAHAYLGALTAFDVTVQLHNAVFHHHACFGAIARYIYRLNKLGKLYKIALGELKFNLLHVYPIKKWPP